MMPHIHPGFRLLIIIIFISLSGRAQQFNGGLVGGLVGSQVAGDMYSGYNKAGINAGGWISLPVGHKSEFRLELCYTQKGSRENPDYEKGKFDAYIMRLGYVEMPLVYRYLYNDRFSFETGLGMNILLHHGEHLNGYETTYSPFNFQNLTFIAALDIKLNSLMSVNLRTDNSLFSIRKNRVSGDVWRFWSYGQFSDALVLSVYYTIKRRVFVE